MIKAARLFNWQGHLGLGYFDPESLLQDQNEPTKETPSRPSRLRGSNIETSKTARPRCCQLRNK